MYMELHTTFSVALSAALYTTAYGAHVRHACFSVRTLMLDT